MDQEKGQIIPKVDISADVVNQHTGEKWYYSDIVKEHFFNPRNLMLEDPDESQYQAVGMVGSPACGDMMKMWLKIEPQTERVKEMKWRTFGSLIADERVVLDDFSTAAAENLREGMLVTDASGKANVIESVFKKRYFNKVLSIRLATSSYYTFTVTPGHPVPCIERYSVSYPHRKGKRWSEVHQNLVENSEIVTKSAGELREGDFLIYKVDGRLIDQKDLTDEFCSILGYYVSDGHAASPKRVRFDFGLTEDEYVNEVAGFAKRNNIAFRIYERTKEHILSIQLTDRKLVSLLTHHGGLATKKRFSREVLNLPPGKQMRIIDSYLRGDGWFERQKATRNEQYFISTSLEHLANQLQVMLARNKIFAPIHKRLERTFTIRGKTYKNKGEFNLIFRKKAQYSRIKYCEKGKYFMIPIGKISARNYRGYIYDFGLTNPPYIYRLNGISFHNCGSAIAATSMFSVMVTENGGFPMEDALKIKPQHIMERLGGLPNRKIHCSVLADKAFRKAANEYFRRTGQVSRIIIEGARVVDSKLNITDKDIEEAVLEGATDLDGVQKKLKVGVGSPEIITEVEQLIRFYKEKYYG